MDDSVTACAGLRWHAPVISLLLLLACKEGGAAAPVTGSATAPGKDDAWMVTCMPNKLRPPYPPLNLCCLLQHVMQRNFALHNALHMHHAAHHALLLPPVLQLVLS
jgi:hypothetical protein